MKNSEAKFYLSIKDGIFEISGSELFVSQQIENFKEIIIEAIQSTEESPEEDFLPEAAPPALTQATSQSDKVNSEIADEESFDAGSFSRVLHIDGQEVRVIKKMPGNTIAKRAINTALAYLWGKRSVGVNAVKYDEIREVCKEQGCLDSSNFSYHMKSAREHIIVSGKKGSSAKTCKLTIPGVERAEELLEDLNGE